MTELSLPDVMAWIEKASKDDLAAVADELIEREFACHPDDVTELEHELSRLEDEDDRDDGLMREAAVRLQRRDYPEALHILAAALGRDFDRLETIPLVAA